MLSELGRAYLEHFDSISAGKRALVADVESILDEVHAELKRSDPDCVPDREDGLLQLDLTSDKEPDEIYRLSLTWSADEGWLFAESRDGVIDNRGRWADAWPWSAQWDVASGRV